MAGGGVRGAGQARRDWLHGAGWRGQGGSGKVYCGAQAGDEGVRPEARQRLRCQGGGRGRQEERGEGHGRGDGVSGPSYGPARRRVGRRALHLEGALRQELRRPHPPGTLHASERLAAATDHDAELHYQRLRPLSSVPRGIAQLRKADDGVPLAADHRVPGLCLRFALRPHAPRAAPPVALPSRRVCLNARPGGDPPLLHGHRREDGAGRHGGGLPRARGRVVRPDAQGRVGVLEAGAAEAPGPHREGGGGAGLERHGAGDVDAALPAQPHEHGRVPGGDRADGRDTLRELQGAAVDEGGARESGPLPLGLRGGGLRGGGGLGAVAGAQRPHPPLALPRRPLPLGRHGPRRHDPRRYLRLGQALRGLVCT
mmetsp:Transcript_93187/g.272745  ORF Transcript_93187/g.272745 Transcript_93187/m.272745 type:complete len:370 (+) Transcript_93187:3090-4199(+)